MISMALVATCTPGLKSRHLSVSLREVHLASHIRQLLDIESVYVISMSGFQERTAVSLDK